jgi:hypothetical protein
MTHQQAAEVAQPGVGPLDDPGSAVTPQLAAVLMRRLRVVRPLRDDRFDPLSTFASMTPPVFAA